jgi:Cu2+-containing amine oxidase
MAEDEPVAVAVRHPLDPLSADEIRQAVSILRRDKGVGPRWRFGTIELREPSKRSLAEGAALGRQAEAVCWNRDDGQTYKAIEDALERDKFLTADMAHDFGIVDKVIDKRPEEVTPVRVP